MFIYGYDMGNKRLIKIDDNDTRVFFLFFFKSDLYSHRISTL